MCCVKYLIERNDGECGMRRLQNSSSGNVLPALKVADVGNNFLQGSIPASIGAPALTLITGPGLLHPL